MVWGYAKGFTIVHVKPPESNEDKQQRKKRTRLNCHDCFFYQRDRSCSKKGIPVSEIGYDSWKWCKHFYLDEEKCSSEKIAAYKRWKNSEHYRQYFDKTSERRDCSSQQENYSFDGRNYSMVSNVSRMYHISDFSVGKTIMHKSMGKGKIVAVNKDVLTVAFQERELKISAQYCLSKGIITLVSSDNNDVIYNSKKEIPREKLSDSSMIGQTGVPNISNGFLWIKRLRDLPESTRENLKNARVLFKGETGKEKKIPCFIDQKNGNIYVIVTSVREKERELFALNFNVNKVRD